MNELKNNKQLIDSLSQDIKDLTKYSSVSLLALNEDKYKDVRDKLYRVTTLAKVFQDEGKYKEYLKILNEYIPKEITFGTVGSYLFGCIYSDDNVCNPLCIGSIPVNPIKHCEQQVWIKYDGSLIKLTHVKGNDAVIYANTLTDEDKNILKKHGVINYTLINNGVVERGTMSDPTPKEEVKKETFDYKLILIVIIVIIILILLYYLL